MKNPIVKLLSIITISIVLASLNLACAQSDMVAKLQTEWAIANYQLTGDEQVDAFKQLLSEAEQAIKQQPDNADILIWSGIIKSTYAGVKGGIGALKFAKASKADLEHAIELEPQALQGSAYTSLGALYYKVPGWPLGFGNKKKASELLQLALEINPDGIDPNYFYGDYLRTKKQYKAASDHFKKALVAAPREGRELADASRRDEIKLALAEIKDKMK